MEYNCPSAFSLIVNTYIHVVLSEGADLAGQIEGRGKLNVFIAWFTSQAADDSKNESFNINNDFMLRFIS